MRFSGIPAVIELELDSLERVGDHFYIGALSPKNLECLTVVWSRPPTRLQPHGCHIVVFLTVRGNACSWLSDC